MTSGKPLKCETKWSSIQRPSFSPGLLLEDEDLNAGVSYTQALMRLMLRSMFGCGVVCGLKVSVVPTCKDTKRRIDITRGVAVDGEGNLIEVTEPWTHEFGPDCDDGWPPKLWVVLCYVEQCCRPKDVACGLDDDGGSRPTRVRAGYKIEVSDHPPKCACRCRTSGDDEEDDDASTNGCCGGSKKRRRAAALVESTGTSTGTTDTGSDGTDATDRLDPCDCYNDHFNGVCDCGCSCRCVVLARIVDPGTIISKDDDGSPLSQPYVEVDATMVRRIRPVLNGYLECRFPRTASEEDESESEEGYGAGAADEEARQISAQAAKLRAAREKRRAALQKSDKTKAKGDRDQIDNG